MANYQNSLGESELFGRMTAGFAKVCESVQSGKFVRNEMGVICESVCEDEDDIERDSMFGDDDVFIGRNDEYYNEDPDNEPVFTPAYWTYSMDGADDECFAKEGPVFKLTDEGKRDFEEWWNAEQVGTDLCYGRFKDEKFGKKHLSREQEWEYLTDPKNGLSVEVTGKVEEDDVVTDGDTQDADVASATPEQINGSVNEGEKLTKGAVDAVVKPGSDNALTNSGDAPDGWAVLDVDGETVVDFGTLDEVVAGAIENGVEFDVDEDMLPKFLKWYDALDAKVVAGASLTECDGKNKKPLKKLIPEGCCGGKAKKVLKEEVQKLCKTCGNPLDETGTCQDCQGYSEVKEGEGDLKVNLKANAKANQEKVAQAIRDGKADGIVKEGLDYHKNVDKITKDDMFGMLVNLLYQIRDGVSVEDVTTNPDIDEFDDYSLDEVLELAKKYEV